MDDQRQSIRKSDCAAAQRELRVARIQFENVIPMVQRIIYIYKKQGLQLPQIDNKTVTMVPESPLVRSQDQEDIANLLRYSEALGLLFGPEAAIGAQEPLEAIPWLAEHYRIEAKLVPSRDTIEARLAKAAEVAESQLAAGQG